MKKKVLLSVLLTLLLPSLLEAREIRPLDKLASDTIPYGLQQPDTVGIVDTFGAVGTGPYSKGSYHWVPDSLADEVDQLLKGHSRVVYDSERLDAEEKTIFHGDTLNMVLRQRNLGRFDRGLFNFLFIPRGQWQIGLTAAYGEVSTEDTELLSLMKDFDMSAHTFSIQPFISYFVRSNLSVGVRLGYTSSKASINSLSVDIDEDMNFNLHDIMYRRESYTAAVVLRQYYGLSRRGRIGVFNEVELAFSSGNGNFKRPYDSQIKDTRSTFMSARLNFSPGLTVMMMKNVSFNLSFGVFGFYLENEKQMVDGVDMGNRFTSGANFRFNIFNINFGLGVHF